MKKAKALLKNWRIAIPFLFLYLEIIFHMYMKLDMTYMPVFLLLAFSAGLFWDGVLFFLPDRPARIAGGVLVVMMSLIFIIECICRDILQQYFQIFGGAEIAVENQLTDYTSTVIQSFWENKTGIFLLFVLPVSVYNPKSTGETPQKRALCPGEHPARIVRMSE